MTLCVTWILSSPARVPPLLSEYDCRFKNGVVHRTKSSGLFINMIIDVQQLTLPLPPLLNDRRCLLKELFFCIIGTMTCIVERVHVCIMLCLLKMFLYNRVWKV